MLKIAWIKRKNSTGVAIYFKRYYLSFKSKRSYSTFWWRFSGIFCFVFWVYWDCREYRNTRIYRLLILSGHAKISGMSRISWQSLLYFYSVLYIIWNFILTAVIYFMSLGLRVLSYAWQFQYTFIIYNKVKWYGWNDG